MRRRIKPWIRCAIGSRLPSSGISLAGEERWIYRVGKWEVSSDLEAFNWGINGRD
ncbi:hypothetical protein DsansV1_C25g0187791 [Dioscorea sansibarensis]